jgi:insulysin
LTLPGGLRAFLTSDPASDFAAAAVDVGRGSADDPSEFPGLAHFLEHMLFMGSEKYPKEDEYSKFLTQNGGYDNAFTADEHTNFFFKVRAKALPEALDRFAQFFASPLLRESSASREVMAVDSEHHKNLNSDGWRFNQVLLRECGGRPDHFGTGDRHTLREGSREVVEALRKFHSENYVADNLRLSILGQESLDDLEKIARSAFEHVRRGKAPPRNISDLPGPPKDVCAGGHVYIVRPLGDMQTLVLAFPAREMKSEAAQRSAVLGILRFALSGRHEGGLYEDLKKRGWATSVDFGVDVNLADISTLELSVDLTSSGLAAVPDVVDVVLSHLKLVVEALEAYAKSLKGAASNSGQEAQEDVRRLVSSANSSSEICEVWSDMEEIAALNFHFQENSDPASFVSDLAASLRTLGPRDVLGSDVASTLDAEMIISITTALDSRHKLPSLWIYHKDFDGGDSLRDALTETQEPIYGTTYFKGDLPD